MKLLLVVEARVTRGGEFDDTWRWFCKRGGGNLAIPGEDTESVLVEGAGRAGGASCRGSGEGREVPFVELGGRNRLATCDAESEGKNVSAAVNV